MSGDIGFSIEELEELYVVFKVRSRYGILFYVAAVRQALLLNTFLVFTVFELRSFRERTQSQWKEMTHST